MGIGRGPRAPRPPRPPRRSANSGKGARGRDTARVAWGPPSRDTPTATNYRNLHGPRSRCPHSTARSTCTGAILAPACYNGGRLLRCHRGATRRRQLSPPRPGARKALIARNCLAFSCIVRSVERSFSVRDWTNNRNTVEICMCTTTMVTEKKNIKNSKKNIFDLKCFA